MTQQFTQYLEKINNKIQDLLEQVRDEDDISKVTEIYDKIATHADKTAESLNRIGEMLDDTDEDEEGEKSSPSGQAQDQQQSDGQQQNGPDGSSGRQRRSREKAGSR